MQMWAALPVLLIYVGFLLFFVWGFYTIVRSLQAISLTLQEIRDALGRGPISPPPG